jgi:hypothetical protein
MIGRETTLALLARIKYAVKRLVVLWRANPPSADPRLIPKE